MGMIRHQNALAKLEQAKKEQALKDAKMGLNSGGGGVSSNNLAVGQSDPTKSVQNVSNNMGSGQTGSVSGGLNQVEKLKLLIQDIDEDNLITYREFMNAIKGLKDTLYKSILPRTLQFL